jgi:hypothetical protein
MDTNFEKTAEEAAAFQKIFLETMSKMMQSAFTFTPNSPPPEVLQQIRSGIFRALAESWEEFMRSPQFLEGMKQWMENAVTFRKMTNDFMGRMRNEMQAPSRSDVDTIMLTVRHLERRILDRLDELSAQISARNGQSAPKRKGNLRAKPTQSGRVARKTAANRKSTTS